MLLARRRVTCVAELRFHIQFNRQKSPYQLMTRFGSEELVRYEGSLNRSSAWACEAVAGVERAIRALLSPSRRPCTARTAFNLATTRRCCVAVRAIVKPYVLGRTRKTLGSTRTFWAGTLVSLRMCHIRRRPRRPVWISIAFFYMGFAAQNPTWGFYTGINYCAHLRGPFSTWGFPLSARNDTD